MTDLYQHTPFPRMNHRHCILLIICLAATFSQAESPIRSGDRIALVGNTFADQLRIHGYLETLLLQHTIDKPVSIRNLGWGGDMLTARDRPTNFPSEETTLTAHQTDVIIACFGMGESFGGKASIGEFKRQLQAFIESHAGQSYNGESAVRLILVSPIACEDLGDLTPRRNERNGDLGAYTQAMKEVAEKASVPFVDLFAPSRYLMDESAGPNLTSNGIHLNSYGYWALSQAFFSQLTSDNSGPPQPWSLSINFAESTAEANGVQITALSKESNRLRFEVTETTAPTPTPPSDQSLPPQLEFQRDTLKVLNLPAGTYQLTVDKKTVATASAGAWSEGVAIDASPAHDALESYRKAVNDKNLQFVYSWKALNQVHIVGERKKSPSGRALPGEVIEFDRLARKQDAELRSGIELKTRVWLLRRVGD